MNISAIALVAYLAIGISLGALYFGGVWWSAYLFVRSGRISTTIALLAGRFALLGGALTLVSLEGALPLLMTALGVLIGRFVVVRRLGDAAP